MGKQTESYRKMHPEQFSDSKIVKKGKLDRDFLDFYFETITSKSLDKQFEDCCRHIAENEICPNLLPQTGPTGGGDSKVDSETYPVSEQISTLWFYGEGNKAAKERWAFAISAKKDWKPKVKSDIEKIIKVNLEESRGYTKIFFMSNQYISDKKRAETEDLLRKQYDLDVRILDRTWLLGKILSNQKNINAVIKSFGLSDTFSDEIQVGKLDYERKKEYEEIEERIKKQNIKNSEKIECVQRSVVLAREQEFPREQVLGLIERSIRISKEFGLTINLADAYYDAAWTVYWWYSDTDLYYEYYTKYEKLALSEMNVSLFGHLITLWINLFAISLEKNISIEEHTSKIKERYEMYMVDKSKPNAAIEARAAYQPIRIFFNDDINDIVDEMIRILDESFGHLDLDLYPMRRIIQDIPLFEEATHYEELFERLVVIMSSQEQKTEAALMLAKRGRALKDKKPYDALKFYSRTLMSLFNERNKHDLICVIMEMGEIFERIGLLWAARNFYYYAFCLCLNQYMKFGDASPWFFMSANALKYIELRLGQILYATEFHHLQHIAEQCYPKTIEKSEESENNFDYVLAIQILRTSFEVEKTLEGFPEYLSRMGLMFSEAAMKYELGYYDEDILASLGGNKDAFDDLMSKWKLQPALGKLKEPWYGKETTCIMATRILGCAVEARINKCYEHGEIEVAATILATIESFFATGLTNNLISMAGKVIIDICYEESCEEYIKAKISKERPNHVKVLFSEYDVKEIIETQKKFTDFITELMGIIISIMFPYEGELLKIEAMIKNDAAFDRAYIFSNSVFYGMETLGKEIFKFDKVLGEYDALPMIRSKKTDNNSIELEQNKEEEKAIESIKYGGILEDSEFKNLSNEKIITSSIVNNSIWNISKWRGVLFISDSYLKAIPPILSFVFEKESGKGIFKEWIEELGTFDIKNEIGICIIKGINKKNPYWYRVIIGSLNKFKSNTDGPKIMALPSRVHTMMPSSNANLKQFEDAIKLSNNFYICPSIMPLSASQPQVFQKLAIKKNMESLSIYNAYEIQANDILAWSGILPTDDPIIPKGKEDAPVLKIIEEKKNIIKNKS